MLGLVWAQSRDGVIGRDGTLPWHLPEDLRLFRETTTGATVVMGRRTWESLPERFRPLPGRVNVVLSREPGFAAPGAQVAPDLDAALAGRDGPVWVIGGGQVYAAAIGRADRLLVTEVDLDLGDGTAAGDPAHGHPAHGDVHAPRIGPGWAVEEQTPWQESTSGLRFRVRRYRRRPGSSPDAAEAGEAADDAGDPAPASRV